MLTKKRVGNQTSFKQINLPSFGAMFCENFWKPKLYTSLLLLPGRIGIDGSVYKWLRPSGSCSECARLGSCTQIFGGDCRPGEWDLPSTVWCSFQYSRMLLWALTYLSTNGKPYPSTAIGERPSCRSCGRLGDIGGCYGKASSQSPPSHTPKCVMINGVGCVMWGTCTTSAEG